MNAAALSPDEQALALLSIVDDCVPDWEVHAVLCHDHIFEAWGLAPQIGTNPRQYVILRHEVGRITEDELPMVREHVEKEFRSHGVTVRSDS